MGCILDRLKDHFELRQLRQQIVELLGRISERFETLDATDGLSCGASKADGA